MKTKKIIDLDLRKFQSSINGKVIITKNARDIYLLLKNNWIEILGPGYLNKS